MRFRLSPESCLEGKLSFTFVDLFAGIGGFHQAAHSLGGECLFASEIDEHAQKAYQANFNIQPHGDITQISGKAIPDHDMLCAGFPCQPFSIIGHQKGFDDARGTLFFDIARILDAKQPPMIVLENVKQLSTHNKGKTLQNILMVLEELGYKTQSRVLNAMDYGLPQKRERTIIVGFTDHNVDFVWPKKARSMTPLAELLEADVDQKYMASKMIRDKRREKHTSEHQPSIWHENKSGNVTSYPYSCALRAGASYNYLLVDGVRRLTPRETLRLQGFAEDFKIVCSDSQTKKQTGNAVPVPMIRAVMKEVLNAKAKAERFKEEARKRAISAGEHTRECNSRSLQEACL